MGLGRGSGFSDGNITIGTQVDTYGISQGLNKIQKSFNRLKNMAGLLGGFGLIKLGKQAIEAASNLAEVQNIVDVSFGEMEYKIEEFSKTCIDNFGMSEFSAKQTAGSFMAMGKAAGISLDEASDMAVRLTALSGDMASFYNIRQEYAKVALSAVYTGETETLKRYGIILTEANLQQYALTQGITTSVKAMSARDKAMLRYNYILQATADVTGDFVRTQNNWANQTRVLKELWNQFLITIGSGLITILKPALKILNTFIKYLTAWANKVGHILAKLLGIEWEEISSGAGGVDDEFGSLGDSTDDLADSTGDLGSSVKKAGKEARKALAPFDELNVIEEDLASSTDDVASGLGAIVPMTGFDMSDIMGGGFSGDAFDIELPDISSWYDFGKYLSDTFKDQLDKINWPDIYKKAKELFSNLADFLNGLIQPDTFFSIGVTLGGLLNTAIESALSFGKEFNWVNFGVSLSEAFNGFFEEWNAEDAAEVINTWADGFWEAIKAFFAGDEDGNGGIDWPLIENKFDDFFGTLYITKAPNGLIDLIKGDWSEGVQTLFENYFHWTPDWLLPDELEDPGMQQAWIDWFIACFDSPADFLTQIAQFLFDPNYWNDFYDVPGLQMWASMLGEEMGRQLRLSIENTIYEFINEALWDFQLITDKFQFICDTIGGWFEESWAQIQFVWEMVPAWFYGNVLNPLKNFFYELYTKVKNVFSTLWSSIKTIWSIVSEWFNTKIIQPIIILFSTLKTKVSNFFTTLWDTIKNVWVNASAWFSTYVITPITNFFSTMWENITIGIKTGINAIIGVIEDFINAIIDGINFFASGISFLADAASKITGEDYSSIITLQHITIPRLAQGGVIPPNKEFLAVLGDQKHGTNIEAPLDTIVDAMKVALSNSENGLVQALLQQQVQLLEIIADKCGITDRDIANSIRRTNNEYVKMTGTGLLG